MGFDTIKSFLIADEDSDVREAISDAIKHFYKDCRIYLASDGSEAMQKVRNAPPNIIIIDLDMPKVSGVETLEQMQKVNSFTRIPIIVMSGLDQDSEVLQQIADRGMIFLQKPFKTQVLTSMVESALTGNKAKPMTLDSKKLAPGEVLFRDGEASGNMYLVKTGKLRVYKGESDATKEIGVIGPNELVGEMAFVDRKARSATVEAIEESELIELPINDVHLYLAQQPIWLRTLINTILSRLRATIAKD